MSRFVSPLRWTGLWLQCSRAQGSQRRILLTPGLVAAPCYALSVSLRSSLARKLGFVPLPNLPSSSPPLLFLFLFLHRKKKFLATDPNGIYKSGVNLAPGSARGWREGLVQRSELSGYLSSTVKSSILEKNIHFSIAFLGLTINKKNIYLVLKKRTLSLHSHKSCSSMTKAISWKETRKEF